MSHPDEGMTCYHRGEEPNRTTQPKGNTVTLTDTTSTSVTLTVSDKAYIEAKPMDSGTIRVEWFVMAEDEGQWLYGPTIYMTPAAADRLGSKLISALADLDHQGPMTAAARVAAESNRADAIEKARQLLADHDFVTDRLATVDAMAAKQRRMDDVAAQVRHSNELDIEGGPYEEPDPEHSIRQCEGQCNDPAHNMLTPNEIYEASIREDLSDQAAREMTVHVIEEA